MAYKYYRTITIDKDKVGIDNADTTISGGFPVLLTISGTYLKNTANGGRIENAQGWDIKFTEDDRTTHLCYEIQSYDSSAGTLMAWVKIDPLSKATDTDFMMHYGNSSITEPTCDTPNTWTNDFEAVYHMEDDSDSPDVSESVEDHPGLYSDDAGLVDTSSATVSGKIGNALTFNDNKVTLSGIHSSGHRTLSAWVRTSSSTKQDIINNEQDTWSLRIVEQLSGPPSFTILTVGGYASADFGSTQYDGEWHHLVGTYDGDAVRIYVDAVEGTPDTAPSGDLIPITGDTLVGVHANLSSNPVIGDIDEVRIANIARSHDWIKTEFNNQDSPSTFYVVGEEFRVGHKFNQTLGGSPMGIAIANIKSVIGVDW